MLLSELTGKTVYSSDKAKGTCRGVALSLKSKAIRYLVCANDAVGGNAAQFFIPVGNVEAITESRIVLKRMRTAAPPKNCVCFYSGIPVYFESGAYLGKTTDLEIKNFIATNLSADTGKRYKATCITGVRDAVVLKKAPAFPLGEPIPHAFSAIYKGQTVTKSLLKHASKRRELIALTRAVLPQ